MADDVAALGYCVERIAGATRVETSVAIAGTVVAEHGCDRVLIVRADDWADAATGGAFPAATRCPIVVTQREALHPAVEGFFREQRVSSAVLLGGTAALSAEVEAAVHARIGAVTRTAGAARDATAAEIARQLWSSDAFAGAVILNGYQDDSWMLAQAAAVYSARTGRPQLWTQADALLEPTTAIATGLEGVTVIGSTADISGAVAGQLEDALGGPARPGQDRAGLYLGDPLSVTNYYREVGGVPPLAAFDEALSLGAFEHSRYTVEESHPGHDEDPLSPWSTPASRGELPGTWGGEVVRKAQLPRSPPTARSWS